MFPFLRTSFTSAMYRSGPRRSDQRSAIEIDRVLDETG